MGDLIIAIVIMMITMTWALSFILLYEVVKLYKEMVYKFNNLSHKIIDSTRAVDWNTEKLKEVERKVNWNQVLLGDVKVKLEEQQINQPEIFKVT